MELITFLLVFESFSDSSRPFMNVPTYCMTLYYQIFRQISNIHANAEGGPLAVSCIWAKAELARRQNSGALSTVTYLSLGHTPDRGLTIWFSI